MYLLPDSVQITSLNCMPQVGRDLVVVRKDDKMTERTRRTYCLFREAKESAATRGFLGTEATR